MCSHPERPLPVIVLLYDLVVQQLDEVCVNRSCCRLVEFGSHGGVHHSDELADGARGVGQQGEDLFLAFEPVVAERSDMDEGFDDGRTVGGEVHGVVPAEQEVEAPHVVGDPAVRR